MSGKQISDKQVNLYMTQRAKHSQVIAAAKSGLSSRTAGRIDNQIHQPKLANRHWRTREDPLSVIWVPIVLPLLQQAEGLTPVGIFDFLCERHSNQFDAKTRRTLEWTLVDYVDTGASDKKQATTPRRLHFTSNFIAIQIRFKVPESRNSRTLVQCFVIGIFIFS